MSSPRTHPAPAYASSSARLHPYAHATHRQRYAQPHHHHRRRRSPGPADELPLPPSPPRSNREGDSPSVNSTTPVDPNDNYWDDVPAPPALLKSILDSFRASGEGDRDLLLAILGAKKAEEDRLTAIIQTRLTVLQARLNLAAIQAQLAQAPMSMPPPDFVHHERTPSLSNSSSSPPSSTLNSPPLPKMAMKPHYYDRERVLPPPPQMGYDRLPPIHPDHRERSDSGSSRRPEGLEMLLEGVREAERKERA